MTDTYTPNNPLGHRTRNGRKARIITTNVAGPQSIGALVTLHNGHESFCTYSPDGRFIGGTENDLDLIDITLEVPRELRIAREAAARFWLGKGISDHARQIHEGTWDDDSEVQSAFLALAIQHEPEFADLVQAQVPAMVALLRDADYAPYMPSVSGGWISRARAILKTIDGDV